MESKTSFKEHIVLTKARDPQLCTKRNSSIEACLGRNICSTFLTAEAGLFCCYNTDVVIYLFFLLGQWPKCGWHERQGDLQNYWWCWTGCYCHCDTKFFVPSHHEKVRSINLTFCCWLYFNFTRNIFALSPNQYTL